VVRNAWSGRDESFSGAMVKARDFTDYYRKQLPSEAWPIGRALPSGYGFGPVGTTAAAEKPCEVLPASLIGAPWAQLDAGGKSTFKVTRAVAEVECFAFFDVVNAFDGAIESMGIFHFAMLQAGDGELLDRKSSRWAPERRLQTFVLDPGDGEARIAARRCSLPEDGAASRPEARRTALALERGRRRAELLEIAARVGRLQVGLLVLPLVELLPGASLGRVRASCRQQLPSLSPGIRHGNLPPCHRCAARGPPRRWTSAVRLDRPFVRVHGIVRRHGEDELHSHLLVSADRSPQRIPHLPLSLGLVHTAERSGNNRGEDGRR